MLDQVIDYSRNEAMGEFLSNLGREVRENPMPLVLIGLMTAVCHLYQALDDRTADAANAITTTAVRSIARMVGVQGDIDRLGRAPQRPHQRGRDRRRVDRRDAGMEADDLDVLDLRQLFHHRPQPPRR